ncbi:unnamed protein product [Rhizophagus irregularis]|nr:unnamed protein product [Rhizophagus irregularis]
MFNQKNWQGRILEVREDRGFVIQIPITTLTSTPKILTGPGGPLMGMGGIFYGSSSTSAKFAGRLLFVGNVAAINCQWQDLKDLFRNAGNIIRADVSTNFDGRTHLPPPVHPHHRPPLISHHNFHLGPPPIPHHFMPPAHMGPFSPPLTTPSLTSPPFPSSQIIQDQPISTPTTQFPGFGPIGKTNHSPQSTVTSSISNLGAVGAFPSNTTNGIANHNGINGTTDGNNNNYGSGNDNAIHGPPIIFSSSSPPSPSGDPNGLSPHHHHQVAAAAAAHHHQQHHHHQHSHGQHPHHHHHPGAIGSGLVGINTHIHSQVNGTSDSSVSVTTTSGLGSSSTTTEVTNNSANNSNNSTNSSVPGLWDNSTSTMLSTAAAVSNGSNGTVNSGSVISIGMTSSLTGMGGLDNPSVGVSPLYL